MRERLAQRPQLAGDVRLLTTSEDEAGTLTEIRGAAAVVTPLGEDALEGVDVAFFCGGIEATRPILAELSSDTTAIVLSPGANRGDGVPIVAGVNQDAAAAGKVLVSPHPGVVALAHLLHPLRALRLVEAVATIVQPASLHEEVGLHELFEQTRHILAFTAQPPSPVFGHQLAFNLMPVAAPADALVGQLTTLLGEETDLAVQVIQGGVFHGVSVSLYLRLEADPGDATLRNALRKSPAVELFDDPDHLGPIDTAQSESLLLGRIHPDPRRPGAYWLWATIDNLTRGGAINALDIAEAVLG